MDKGKVVNVLLSRILAVTIVTIWTGISQAQLTTVTFQNGVNGYTGAQDTYVVRTSGDKTNNGGNTSFEVSGALSNVGFSGLLKFGNLFGTGANQIPPGATITSATLTLTAYKRYQNVADAYIDVHQMLTDWVAGTAISAAQAGSSCFVARHYRADGDYADNPGDAWGTDGLVHDGPVKGTDFGSSYYTLVDYLGSTIGTDTSIVPITFTLTSLVQAWQADPSSNYGMLFRTNNTYTYAYFYSSDYTDPTLRPQLTVQYIPALTVPEMTIAQYRMDQGIGGSGYLTVKDISGNGHDLVFNSTNFSLQSDNPFNNSHSQSVYRPDANLGTTWGLVSNPGTINLNANANGTARTFTMEGWFKPTLNTAGVGLMHFISSSGGTTNLILETDANSKIIANTYLPGGTWQTVTSAAPMPLNQWTHVAMVGDTGGNISLYVNAALQGMVHQGINLPSSADAVYVGYATNESNNFVGYIDDVRICDDAMTSSEINDDYTHTFTVARTVYADAAEFGGFDPNNATTALQNALNCDEATTVIVPNEGTPWYVDPIYVDWSNGVDIEFQDGAVIEAREGSFLGTTDRLFRFNNVRNMTVSGYGATFQMRKLDYENTSIYPASEFRHTIGLYGAENTTIKGLTLKDSGGDGIEMSIGFGGVVASLPSQNVTIQDVVFSNHYRQGMSVISAEGLLVEGSVFTGTSGTAPQGGIDIEPDDANYDHISDITIRNCVISSNVGHGIQVMLENLPDPGTASGIIENCTFYANGGSGIYFNQSTPNVTVKDSLLVNNSRYGMEQNQSPASTVTYSAFWGNTLGAVNANVSLGTGCLTAVQPVFASTTFGDANYMYLASSCPVAITAGASDGGAMGDRLGVQLSPVLYVNTASQSVGYTTGTTTFTVSNTGGGTLSWTAAVTSGSEWLSITSGTSGTNAGTITANYQANTGAQRTGTIHIDAGSAGTADVTVIQAAGQVQTPTVHGTVTYTDVAGYPLNTVTIEIRSGSTVVETHSALALTGSTGSKTYTFTTSLTGSYTLAIDKNAQTGWNESVQTGVTLAADTTVNFTVTHALAGDASMDGKVDVSDLGILAANYGQTGKTWSLGDFNGDGKVDVSDLGILAAHYGQGSGGATQATDFQQDMKALGFSVDNNTGESADTQKTQTEENPVAKSLGGCGSAGLPLIAGVLLMGLCLIKLEE